MPSVTVRGARRREAAHAVDLDEAHAAHADRLHALVPAEARDVDAVLLRDLDEQLALAAPSNVVSVAGRRVGVDSCGSDLRRSIHTVRRHSGCPRLRSVPDPRSISARKNLSGSRRLRRAGPEGADRGLAERRVGRRARCCRRRRGACRGRGRAFAVRHPVENLLDPARAFPARRALSARLVCEELREPPRDQRPDRSYRRTPSPRPNRASHRRSAARSPCRAARRGARRCRSATATTRRRE